MRDEKGLLGPKDPEQLLDARRDACDFIKHHIIKWHVAARSCDELLHRVAEILDQEHVDHAATGLRATWLCTHFANFR